MDRLTNEWTHEWTDEWTNGPNEWTDEWTNGPKWKVREWYEKMRSPWRQDYTLCEKDRELAYTRLMDVGTGHRAPPREGYPDCSSLRDVSAAYTSFWSEGGGPSCVFHTLFDTFSRGPTSGVTDGNPFRALYWL